MIRTEEVPVDKLGRDVTDIITSLANEDVEQNNNENGQLEFSHEVDEQSGNVKLLFKVTKKKIVKTAKVQGQVCSMTVVMTLVFLFLWVILCLSINIPNLFLYSH